MIGNEASQHGASDDEAASQSTAANSRVLNAASLRRQPASSMVSSVKEKHARRNTKKGKGAAGVNSAFVKLGTQVTLSDEAAQRILEADRNTHMA